MLTLVTNDDGIYAPGIHALYDALKGVSEVVMVAPDSERSAVGHAITISDPLRAWKYEKNGIVLGYATNGTPADCVKLAVYAILERYPDLVISGINMGPNTGNNIIYSGTVSAATEGSILGIPSFAISLDTFTNADFSFAAAFAARMAQYIESHGLPEGILLNINIPAVPKEQITGIAITRQGKSKYKDLFRKCQDPRKRTYYWLEGEEMLVKDDKNSLDIDYVALRNNMISITPIHYDLTRYDYIHKIKDWPLGEFIK